MSERAKSRVRAVAIVGSGKVGRALHEALRRAGVKSTLRAGRGALPSRPFEAGLLVLAVRDGALGPLMKAMRERGLVGRDTAVVHVAGALGPGALDELRPVSAGVAQMHPMISFASPSSPPTLRGGHVHVQGDPVAVKRARWVCKALGMKPRTFEGLNTVGYHAAAAFVANGAAALAAAGAELLRVSGARPEAAPRMLGPLLRSVAENVEALGLPGALTGPVRRGDTGAVLKHLSLLRELLPGLVPLYLATVRAQIPLARRLNDAPSSAYDQMEQSLNDVDPTAYQH